MNNYKFIAIHFNLFHRHGRTLSHARLADTLIDLVHSSELFLGDLESFRVDSLTVLLNMRLKLLFKLFEQAMGLATLFNETTPIFDRLG